LFDVDLFGMMTIAFVQKANVILLEIAAYQQYFEQLGFQTLVCSPAELRQIQPDIEWHFMGIHSRRSNPTAILIHEYASRSIGPFTGFKDLVKKWLNVRPNFRVFLNEYTRKGLNFKDNVPWGIRTTIYFPAEQQSVLPDKKYDFVYAGTTEASRHPEKWLSWFVPGGPLEGHSVLVLGPRRKELEKKYAYSWIHFHDTVPATEVNHFLQLSRFGINYQPDRTPLNQQPSAKLLAYAAAGLPIITTDYAWIRDFQKKYGGAYFFLGRSGILNWEELNRFTYSSPDLSEWTIDYQLKNSGIPEFLQQLINNKYSE